MQVHGRDCGRACAWSFRRSRDCGCWLEMKVPVVYVSGAVARHIPGEHLVFVRGVSACGLVVSTLMLLELALGKALSLGDGGAVLQREGLP